MSGAGEEDKKPAQAGGAHINLKVKGQLEGRYYCEGCQEELRSMPTFTPESSTSQWRRSVSRETLCTDGVFVACKFEKYRCKVELPLGPRLHHESLCLYALSWCPFSLCDFSSPRVHPHIRACHSNDIHIITDSKVTVPMRWNMGLQFLLQPSDLNRFFVLGVDRDFNCSWFKLFTVGPPREDGAGIKFRIKVVDNVNQPSKKASMLGNALPCVCKVTSELKQLIIQAGSRVEVSDTF